MAEAFHIRAARDGDAAALPGVQLSAGALFRSMPDIAWVADEPVAPPALYLPMIARGHVWVAADGAGAVVGCLFGEIADGAFHILELAVAQEAQRRGLGRRLLDAARACAQTNQLAALTLTTFRHVAWNAPFYARYGFTEHTDPRLAALVAAEIARGLPHRCAMRLALQGRSAVIEDEIGRPS
jgi:GNAT superfamily N-acetyltransferase